MTCNPLNTDPMDRQTTTPFNRGGIMDLDLEIKTYQIVLQAQEMTSPERENYLNRACQGNHDLRMEVDERLKAGQAVMRNFRHLYDWDQDKM